MAAQSPTINFNWGAGSPSRRKNKKAETDDSRTIVDGLCCWLSLIVADCHELSRIIGDGRYRSEMDSPRVGSFPSPGHPMDLPSVNRVAFLDLLESPGIAWNRWVIVQSWARVNRWSDPNPFNFSLFFFLLFFFFFPSFFFFLSSFFFFDHYCIDFILLFDKQNETIRNETKQNKNPTQSRNESHSNDF